MTFRKHVPVPAVTTSRILAVCLLASACTAAARPPRPAAEARGFRVEVTVASSATPSDDAIYLAGSFNGWRPGLPQYRLARNGGGRYSLEVPDTLTGTIEFKFTRGSWESVETDSAGGDVPNRRLTVQSGERAVYTGRIKGWRDPRNKPVRASTARPSVSVLSTEFAIPQLGRTRRVWLYLPPDYSTSSKRYPVLYMHDGQNVFDAATSFAGEWGVDEALDSLAALGKAVPIVVAVDHGGDKRLDELSPWPNQRHGGGEGDRYVEFFVKTLKPYIDSRYRTLPDRLNTGIAGSSMGGLISLFAALKYPDVFGKAGIFSPALWFNPSIYSYAVQSGSVRRGTRFYFVSGALEAATSEKAGVYVHDQARMIEALDRAGFRMNANIVGHIRADGTHSEWFWKREFPAAFTWLFNADGAPRAQPSRSFRSPIR